MKINIYSKPGCGKCEAAKDKLRKMGFDYREHNLAYHIAHHDGWRNDGSIDVLAAHADLDDMPLIGIDNMIYSYSGAMKILKNERRK